MWVAPRLGNTASHVTEVVWANSPVLYTTGDCDADLLRGEAYGSAGADEGSLLPVPWRGGQEVRDR